MDGTIEYLNTDLDLNSAEDLTPLTKYFETQGLYVLHLEIEESGASRVTVETEHQFDEPDANICSMLDIIDALPPDLQGYWSRCDSREFNLGYDCGQQPWAFQHRLTSQTVRRVAAAGASLAWTIYPPQPDTELVQRPSTSPDRESDKSADS